VPIIYESSYRAPFLFSNPHIQTVFPSVFRKVNGVRYQRERIDTPDGDFLDLDWSKVGSNQIAVILHGLEGDSNRAYVLGMVKALNEAGWDAAAMNFRGCSGECNRTLRYYHSGETEDLDTVLSHAVSRKDYSALVLIGFSLGGNVILKYLGEPGRVFPPSLKKAVVFSVPCDLTAGSKKLNEPSNKLYMMRFLRMLHAKIRMKMEIMPERINDHRYDRIKNFKDFDDRYTAPIFGFNNAEDYWEKASSKPFLPNVSIPTLLINAADDPFLPEHCYPGEEASRSETLFLEIPRHGGHVGFVTFNNGGRYWSESRALSFLGE
jgi:predicted alpha/beta-fold hydrolase